MKKSIILASMVWLASTAVSAEEVVTVQEDHVVGGGFGGLSGLMLGAAIGGPVGALVGGGLGYFAGQGVQEAAGLGQNLYVLQGEDGSVVRLRSSSEGFVPGQQVARDGNRLTAMSR